METGRALFLRVSVVVHYPGGGWEVLTIGSVPRDGDAVEIRGKAWRVEAVATAPDGSAILTVAAP